jgi:glycosyltransferase involved in cell wall biosynthesis
VYGAERALLELATYIKDEGWDSHVVALEGQGAGRLVECARSLGLSAEAFVPQGRLGLLPLTKRLRQLIARYPRAIFHSHGYKPDILLALLGITRQRPCLATCHNWISESRKMQLLEALDKRVLRAFDHVVAVSREISGALIRSGVPSQKVSIISNGISVPSLAAGDAAGVRSSLGVPSDARLIVQIGRLARSKRNELLLESVRRLPEIPRVDVLLVGEGEQAQYLTELVERMSLQGRVHFCGYRSDIAHILAAADLLALTSDKEGLPIVILEAMAMRCPIVATRVGEIPHVLRDGEEAWLVPSGDLEALTAAISEALAFPALANARAARARETFDRRYSRASMGVRYLEIYEQAWARRGWS